MAAASAALIIYVWCVNVYLDPDDPMAVTHLGGCIGLLIYSIKYCIDIYDMLRQRKSGRSCSEELDILVVVLIREVGRERRIHFETVQTKKKVREREGCQFFVTYVGLLGEIVK